jgi:hypothetical protein
MSDPNAVSIDEPLSAGATSKPASPVVLDPYNHNLVLGAAGRTLRELRRAEMLGRGWVGKKPHPVPLNTVEGATLMLASYPVGRGDPFVCRMVHAIRKVGHMSRVELLVAQRRKIKEGDWSGVIEKNTDFLLQRGLLVESLYRQHDMDHHLWDVEPAVEFPVKLGLVSRCDDATVLLMPDGVLVSVPNHHLGRINVHGVWGLIQMPWYVMEDHDMAVYVDAASP